MFSNSAPKVYRDNDVFDWIHSYPDLEAFLIDKKVESLRTFLDPDLTSATGLDFIASSILHLNDWFWDNSWKKEWKIATIKNYPKLVRERGNKSILPWLFQLYGLNVKITSSQGWILGTSVFPMQFTSNWNDLKLIIPSNYSSNTPELNLVKLIVKWFVPDLINVTYA